jgi:hypothetical protein
MHTKRLYRQGHATLFCVNPEGWRVDENLRCSLCGGEENVTKGLFMVTFTHVDMSGRFPNVETEFRYAYLRSCPHCQTLYPEGALPGEVIANGTWKTPDHPEQMKKAWEERRNQGI